jgi:hypothetical protein
MIDKRISRIQVQVIGDIGITDRSRSNSNGRYRKRRGNTVSTERNIGARSHTGQAHMMRHLIRSKPLAVETKINLSKIVPDTEPEELIFDMTEGKKLNPCYVYKIPLLIQFEDQNTPSEEEMPVFWNIQPYVDGYPAEYHMYVD